MEMEIHKKFTEWAVARGVKMSGIAAHRFPGRGLGIIAEKDFKASETSYFCYLLCFSSFLFECNENPLASA